MNVVGLMSGTSLDGLDLALVRIEGPAPLSCRLLAAETLPYPDRWLSTLSTLEQASALDYALAHVRLGHYFGQCVNQFLARHGLRADLVASHGHTVFHQPHLGLTSQIGCGDAIAAETRLPVVSNFRALDVALGGQGAPLVPIGDRLLFGEYDACLNLGGIANISYEGGGWKVEGEDKPCTQRVAFDICPCNMALNHLARQLGQPYDRDGLLARQGAVDPLLLERMEGLEYYRQAPPKSLGKEWFVEQFLPLLGGDEACLVSTLRTATEHIARRIAASLGPARSLLATGGGARNTFLIERLRALAPQCRVVLPDPMTIDYKEAILFALLGYLRINRMENTLSSVTGAPCDSIGGDISGLVNPQNAPL